MKKNCMYEIADAMGVGCTYEGECQYASVGAYWGTCNRGPESLLDNTRRAVKWFGFDDYQNCHPVEIGTFAFPLKLPYMVKIWISATRWLVDGEWVYRYHARYQITQSVATLVDDKILTDQRGLDNMSSVGDVLKSAYRWLANNSKPC